MEFKIGDIVVCKPGYNRDGNCISQLSGGSGYEEGMMRQTKIDSSNDNTVHWDFKNGSGVFSQALRHATDQEKAFFHNGMRNVNDIKYTEFKISYTSITNEIKKHISTAHTENEAISEIKDLKSVNYIMSEK